MLENFHEVWWIFSDAEEHWAGLRIAHFRKIDGIEFVLIQGELPERIGLRHWQGIRGPERWHKVARIPIPTAAEIVVSRGP